MVHKFITFSIYALSSMVTAFLFGLFSFFIIHQRLAGQVMLTTFLLNIGFIFIILVIDKISEKRILKSYELLLTQESYAKKGKFAKLLYTADMVSFKSALYLFYIVCLFIARVSYFSEEMYISSEVLYFLASIEYCVYLLIALDKFVLQIQKDEKRISKISRKLSKRTKKMS